MPNKEGKRTCDDCRYCFNQDYGYSNYTTEGTNFFCIKVAHPDDPYGEGYDRFYGENPKLDWAQQCPQFKPGESFDMDCDGENGDVPLTGTQLEVYREIQAQSLIVGRHWLLNKFKEQ